MAYGPHAVARHEGKVVFVRGAGPGEELDAVLREERRSHAFADAAAVLRPSPARRPTHCEYLPHCGGCPWQHLAYPAQLAEKRRIVADHLRRIAGLDCPVPALLPAPHEYGWRRRIKLRVAEQAVGFYRGGSHVLVPVDRCAVGVPTLQRAIPWLRTLVHTLPLPVRRVEILAVAPTEDAVVVVGEVEGPPAASADAACRAWMTAHPEVAGVALQGRGWHRRWGDVAIAFEPEADVHLVAHAPVFTQVNPDMNRLLVALVVDWVQPAPGQRVLDLYAGAGNFTVPLQRRGAAVLAVEQSRQAAADAAANAARAGSVPVQVRTDAAERAVAELARAGATFDAVVLDPPRSGAARCLAPLLHLAPRRLVYVACDPATLARDLAVLRTRYRIDAVQPLDMFPQTYHVETVVRATLSCDTRSPGVSSAWRHESAEPSRRRRTRRRMS